MSCRIGMRIAPVKIEEKLGLGRPRCFSQNAEVSGAYRR
jgi:hypothetical protein